MAAFEPSTDRHAGDRCSACFALQTSPPLAICQLGRHDRRLLVEGQFCQACAGETARAFLEAQMTAILPTPTDEDAGSYSLYMQRVCRARMMYEMRFGDIRDLQGVCDRIAQLITLADCYNKMAHACDTLPE